MTAAIQQIVRSVDAAIASVYLGLFRERSSVLAFLFHSLFRDQREIDANLIDPLQHTTVREFRGLIEYYLESGYRFIGPDQLLEGVDPEGKYALLTFDDGYYNNARAVPILEEFGVPAVFFISTNHVRQNKLFWWDVYYRQRAAEGRTEHQIRQEALAFKTLRTEDIEIELTRRYGPDAFTPRGDLDRPFTPDELREFARCRYVHLGNHTANHAILTNYEPDEIRRQLVDAQDYLTEITGKTPVSVAYPNGGLDDRVVKVCHEVGLKLGFTIRPRKIPPSVRPGPEGMLRLGRFCLDSPIGCQQRTVRSDFQFYGTFRDGYLRFWRGQKEQ